MKFTNYNWSDNCSLDNRGIQNILEKLIEYQIIELKINEDVLKVLIKSNYWKRFYPIETLIIFNNSIIQLFEEDISTVQHFPNYD